jgi:galactokinase
VNGRLLAERLAGAGLDPIEVPAKTRLYDIALSALHELTGSPPEYGSWVPGRLEVFGTHTDYAGGRTLVSALPRGFAFLARPRLDGQLQVVDALAGESVTVDAAASSFRSTGWRHYIEVVVERLARNFPGAELGADIVFASDLPRAAGMSSSSALMVGVATTLVRLAGIRDRPEWRESIGDPLDEAGYYACIENGRPFGRLSGDAGVGTHGGSEDHAAIVCGTARRLFAYAFVPMRRVDSVGVPGEWRIVVAASGVAAEKTGRALDAYNRLARGAAILLDLWNRAERHAPSLASALTSDPSAVERLRALVREARFADWSPDALDRRLLHFVREDARIPEAVRAIRDADAKAVAALATASQSEAEELLQNQVDETAALTRLAIDGGAIASRCFGAGFGGSVWAIIDHDRASVFADEWIDAYRARFPSARATGFVAEPAPSVAELLAGA